MARWFAALVLVMLSVGLPAVAQPSPEGEVTLRLEWFGTGGVARAGEWVGIRVAFTDASTDARNILLRVQIPDVDGDTTIYERAVTTTPARAQAAWLYARLPSWVQQGEALLLTAHEAIESGEGVSARFVPGRRLGTLTVSPQRLMSGHVALAGIVGGSELGLGGYRSSRSGEMNATGGHEPWHVERGLRADALPDRWHGLMQFNVLVWASRDLPELSRERAQAIREWVERGGHLVVVMTASSARFFPGDPVNNPLYPILPRVRRELREGVSLETLRPLISRNEPPEQRRELPMMDINVFDPLPEAMPTDAMRMFLTADGECVVVRRLIGCGAVTMIGLDLESPRMTQVGKPDAEVFWHRILGGRGREYTARDLTDPRTTIPRPNIAHYDRSISDVINMTRRASAGVLLGLMMFVAYWLVAGPLSFGSLKKFGLSRHAWVAFVVCAGLFTALAWGGAALLRPGRVDGRHLTLIEHVYGRPTTEVAQRSRTWASIIIPWYGDATLRVGDPAEGDSPYQDLITAWESWGTRPGASFPDSRPYRIDSRSPHRIEFPARATVKEVVVDWAGPPRWSMPQPIAIAGRTQHGEIRLLPRPDPGVQAPSLIGTLVHQLPGALDDVWVIVIRGQKRLGMGDANQLICEAEAWRYQGSWAPGVELDLSILTTGGVEERVRTRVLDEMLKGMLDTSLPGLDRLSQDALARSLRGLGFISQLPLPTRDNDVAALRRNAHLWDAGRWFTQPCVIVIGQMGMMAGLEGPCSAPIFAGGDGARDSDLKPVPLVGRTVVRWVYPLPEQPVGVVGVVEESTRETEPAEDVPLRGPGRIVR